MVEQPQLLPWGVLSQCVWLGWGLWREESSEGGAAGRRPPFSGSSVEGGQVHTQMEGPLWGWVRAASQEEEDRCGLVTKSGGGSARWSVGRRWCGHCPFFWSHGWQSLDTSFPTPDASKPLPRLNLPHLPLFSPHSPGPRGSSQPLTVLCLPREPLSTLG